MTKYHAKKVKTEDGTFDSQAEYRRWCELKLMERAGEIYDLSRQPRFALDVGDERVCIYVADFEYYGGSGPGHDGHGLRVVEDVKGVKTPIYKLKKKLMLACHGIEIQEVAA